MDKVLFASAFLCGSTLGAAHADVDNGTAYLHAAGNNSTISRPSRRTTLSSEREVLSKSRSAPDSTTDVLPLLLVDPDRINAEAGASVSSMLTTSTGEHQQGSPPACIASGCPAGTEIVGVRVGTEIVYLGADIGGCGLHGCGARYKYDTIEACRDACEKEGLHRCKAFNWAPLNADKNHKDKKVCTMYASDKPTSRWKGTGGTYHQLFCKMNPHCEIVVPQTTTGWCSADVRYSVIADNELCGYWKGAHQGTDEFCSRKRSTWSRGDFAYGTLTSDGTAENAPAVLGEPDGSRSTIAFDDYAGGPECHYQGPYQYALNTGGYNPGRTWCRKACDRAEHCTHYAHGDSAVHSNHHQCLLFNSCPRKGPTKATADTSGVWLEHGVIPKVYKCVGICNGVVTCPSTHIQSAAGADAEHRCSSSPCTISECCRTRKCGDVDRCDNSGSFLDENKKNKNCGTAAQCRDGETCCTPHRFKCSDVQFACISPNYRKRRNYDEIDCISQACSRDECCIQTCTEPQNKVGYAEHIAYDEVRGWIYPDKNAVDFVSLSGLHKCDHDWHGSPKFRCQGPGKVLEMTGCTPLARFKCSDVVHGDEDCAEADPKSVRDENKKSDDCGTSQADCKSGQTCCRKRKCSDVVGAHTDCSSSITFGDSDYAYFKNEDKNDVACGTANDCKSGTTCCVKGCSAADDANNAYIGEDTAALLTLGSNHPVLNNALNFHENFSLLYCNHENGFGGHPHFKCQGPGEQLQVLHCKRATCGAQYNAEKASASAFACDSDYMQRPGYADIKCKEGKCTRDECCARQCQAPASSVDAYEFSPEGMATMLKDPQSYPGSSAWTPDSLACDGNSGFVGQSPTVQCEAENAPLTLAGCSQRFCGTSDPGQTPFACSPDYRKKNNYDEIECKTQDCSNDECCIQNCLDPLDDDKVGYSITDNFAGDEHTAYRQLLDHVEMYPDLASEFTSQPGVGVFKCDHGWHGSPKFRCPGPGQFLEMTGCFDNCRPYVAEGSTTCSLLGYGPATSAAVGRSPATGYEPKTGHLKYSMKTHERALASDSESLTAEECCTRGQQCGGLFMLESEFHSSRVENLKAYAKEHQKGLNWCKTVHRFGGPKSVTTFVPLPSDSDANKAKCCKRPTCAEAFFYDGSGNQCPPFTEGFLQSAHVRRGSKQCATNDCSADDARNVVACCKRRRVCPYDEDTKDELGIFSATIGRKLGKYFNIGQTAVLTNENASGAFSCKGFAFDVPHLSTEPRMDFCQGETCSRSSDLDVAACCRKYVEQEYTFCNSFQTPRFYVNEEAARQACNYGFPRHVCLGYQEDGNVYNSETARLFLNTSLGDRVRMALDLKTDPTHANFLAPRSGRALYGNWSLLLTPKWLDSNCATAAPADSLPAKCRSSHGELAQCVDLTTMAVNATRRRQELADVGLSPEEAPAPADTTSPEGFINVARFDPGNLFTNSTNRASKNRVFLKNRTRESRTRHHNSSFTMEDLGVNLSLLFPYSNMDASSAKASAKRAGQSSMKTRLILPEESVRTLKQSERRILEQAEFDGAAGEGGEEKPTTVTAATGNGELSAVTMRRAMAAALNSYAETAPEPHEGTEGVTEADGTTTSTASTTTAGPTDASSYISKSPAAALQNVTQDAETEAVAPTQREQGQLLQLGGRDGAEKLGRRGRATSDRTSKDINVLDSSTAMSPPFAFVVDIDATSATGEIPETDLAQMLNTSGAAAEVLRKQLAEKILKEQHARGLSSLTLDGISVSIESVSIERKSASALAEEEDQDDAAEDGTEEADSDVGATALIVQQFNSKEMNKLDKRRKTKDNKQQSSYASACDMKDDVIKTLTASASNVYTLVTTHLPVVMYTLFVVQFLMLLYLCRHNLLGRTRTRRPRGVDLVIAAAARQKRKRKEKGPLNAGTPEGASPPPPTSGKSSALGGAGSSVVGGGRSALGGAGSSAVGGGSSAIGGGSSAFGGGGGGRSTAFGGGQSGAFAGTGSSALLGKSGAGAGAKSSAFGAASSASAVLAKR